MPSLRVPNRMSRSRCPQRTAVRSARESVDAERDAVCVNARLRGVDEFARQGRREERRTGVLGFDLQREPVTLERDACELRQQGSLADATQSAEDKAA